MNELTQAQVAWLAGIYEGEGYCNVTKGRAISVQITSTDFDVIDRIVEYTNIGQSKVLPQRKNYKVCKHWNVGGKDAVDFLTTLLPWLCERRKARAEEAISNWRNNRKQSSKGDTHCVNGHELNEKTLITTKGSTSRCKVCRQEAGARYRATHRKEIAAKATARYRAKKRAESSLLNDRNATT